TIDFHGFKLLVNKLHGIYMDVDHRYLNTVGGPGGYAKINLEPGYQRLDGQEALDFVRFRHTDSDLYRVARQQLFVQAMKEQFAKKFSFSIGGAINAVKVITAVVDNTKVIAGGGGSVTGDTIISYAQFIHGLPGGHFFQAKINGITGQYDLTTDQTNIRDAVQQFLTPNIGDVKQANAA